MKKLMLSLSLAALPFLSAPASAALVTGQISLAGYADAIGSSGMGSATGLDFVSGATGTPSPGVAGGLTSFGSGTGSFAGLGCASVGGGCGSIKDITSFTTSLPISSFWSLNTGSGPAISFDLTSFSSITQSPGPIGGSLFLIADGFINYAGFDRTPGVFSLTTQGSNVVSFSATGLSSAVPEPSTWAMMIVGLFGLGFLARGRKVRAVAIG